MLPTISSTPSPVLSRSRTYSTKLKSNALSLSKDAEISSHDEKRLPSIHVGVLMQSPVRSAFEKCADAPKSTQNAANVKSARSVCEGPFLTELLDKDVPQESTAAGMGGKVRHPDFLTTLDGVLLDPKANHDQFYYFVPLRTRDGYGNLYDVTLANNIETQSQDVYLTLSVRGVTQFVHGVPEYFDSIERYRRELLCFNRLKQLKLFSRYRLMKTFGLWKQAFRHRRIQKNSKNLSNSWRFNRIFLQSLMVDVRKKYLNLVSRANFQVILFNFPESVASFFEKINDELTELMLGLTNQFQEVECILSKSLEFFLHESLERLSENDPFKYTACRKIRDDECIANSCLTLCDEMISDFHVIIAINLVKNVLECIDVGNHVHSKRDFEVHLTLGDTESNVPRMIAVRKENSGIFKIELRATDHKFEVVPQKSDFARQYSEVIKQISKLVHVPSKLRDKKIILPQIKMSRLGVGNDMATKNGSNISLQSQPRDKVTSAEQHLESHVNLHLERFLQRLQPSYNMVDQLSEDFRNHRISLKTFRNRVLNCSQEHSDVYRIADLENLLEEGKKLMNDFHALADSKLCGDFLVNCTSAKISLIAPVPACLNSIGEEMLAHFSTTLKSTLDIALEFTKNLAETNAIAQFMFQNEIVLAFRKERPRVMGKKQYSKLCHETCMRQMLEISAEDSVMCSILDDEFDKMEFSIETFDANFEDNFIKFGEILESEARSIKERVIILKVAIEDEMFDGDTEYTNVCLASITELKARHDEISQASQTLITQQKFFNQPESKFEGIDEIGTIIQFKQSVWNLIKELSDAIEKLSPLLVEKIDVKYFEILAKKFQEIITSQTLQSEIFERLKSQVSNFVDMLRITKACQCQDLRTEHWDKIEIILGIRIDRENMSGHSQPFTFQSLMTSSAYLSTKEVVEVAQEAQYQSACKVKFDYIRELWSNCDFSVIPYKGKYDMYCLEKTASIQLLLDNSLIELAQLMSSPYAAAIKAEVQETLTKIKSLGDVFRILLKLESGWLHLEPIFNVGDIQRSLPADFKLYSATDRFRKGFLKSALQSHNVMRNLLVAGFSESLKKQVDNLERVSAGLRSYIAAKRAAFPRFFFASDGDLLSVMAKYKHYDLISDYIGMFFRGIAGVQVKEESEASVVALVSKCGEVVPLLRPCKLRGTPDAWLNELEECMHKQMIFLIKDVVATYQDQILDRWADSAPSQILLLGLHLVMTKSIEMALSSDKQGNASELAAHIEQRISILFILLNMRISNLSRKKYEVLIASYFHFSGLLNEFQQSTEEPKCDSFKWQCQLRSYWKTSDGQDQVIFRQFFSEIYHDFEFLGEQRLFVISPDVNSQMIFITNAVHSFTNCEIFGDTGAGKTALACHLADTFGKISCTVQCSLPSQSTLLMNAVIGSAVCGGWLLVENSMSLDHDVLSVMLNYIQALKNMRGSTDDHVTLDGQAIQTAGIFQIFSINCGKIDDKRSNWKQLRTHFRQVHVIQPDVEEIYRIIFASAGFRYNSQLLSRKWLTLSKLSKDHLKRGCHSVFTLRVLKKVIQDYCELCSNERNEEQFWLFVKKYFQAVMEAEVHEEFKRIWYIVVVGNDSNLSGNINSSLDIDSKQTCRISSTVAADSQLDGIVHAYSSSRTVLLLGDAKSGKSFLLKQLKNYLIDNDIASGNKIERVFETVFPNSIECNDFIGYETKTKHSTSGIFCDVLRRSCIERNSVYTVILDGIPCATWTDYLIGYLESKESFVVNAGEIIHFAGKKPRLVVETDCIKNSAPSFLDRSAMFFIPIASFVSDECLGKHMSGCLKDKIDAKHLDYAWTGLFSKPFLMECIGFVDKYFLCSKFQHRRTILFTCIQLFSGLVTSKYDFLCAQKMNIEDFMKKSFMIAVIWTIGGTTFPDERLKFTEFFRSRYGTLDLPRLPNSATVYDYLINPETMAFCHCKDYTWCRQPEHVVVPFCIANILIETQRASIVIFGPRFSGKSSLLNYLRSQSNQKLNPENLIFACNGQTVASNIRNALESNIPRISKLVFGSANGSPVLIQIDDMSATYQKKNDDSATECIRQLLDGVDELRPSGIFLNMEKSYGRVAHAQLLTSWDSNYDRALSTRLLGHFIPVHLKPISTDMMRQIFTYDVEQGHYQSSIKDFLITFIANLFDCFKMMHQHWNSNRDEFWSEPTIHDCARIMTVVKDELKSTDVSENQWQCVCMYQLSTAFSGMVITMKCKEHVSMILRMFYKSIYPTNPDSDHDLHWFSFGGKLTSHPTREVSCESTTAWIEEELVQYNETNNPPLKIQFSDDMIRRIAVFAKVLSNSGSHLLVSSPSGYNNYGCFRLLSTILRYSFWEFDLKIQTRDALSEIMGKIYLAVGAEQDKALMLVKIDFEYPWNSDILTMLSDLHSLLETGDPSTIISHEEKRKVVEMALYNAQINRTSTIETSEILQIIRKRLQSNLHLVFVSKAGNMQMREQLFIFPAFLKKMTLSTRESTLECEESNEIIIKSLIVSSSGRTLDDGAKNQIIVLLALLHRSALQLEARFSRSNLISCTKMISHELAKYAAERDSKQRSLLTSIKRFEEIAEHLQVSKMKLKGLVDDAEILTRHSDDLSKRLLNAQLDLATVRETLEGLLSDRKIKNAELQVVQEKVRIIMQPSQQDLQSCLQELRTLSKSTVSEFTSIESPEQCLQLVGILISLLFGEAPEWKSLRKINTNEGLQVKLFNYDFSSIPPRLGRQILKIVEVSKLDEKAIERVSTVGKVLAHWLLACIAALKMSTEFAKEIAARDDLALIVQGIASQIEQQRPILSAHKEEAESLQVKFDLSQSSLKTLKKSVDECEMIIQRCSKLLEAFENSVTDWKSQLDEQQEIEKTVVVDFVLACYFASYLGALDSKSRQEIMGKSFATCREKSMPYNQEYVNTCLVMSKIAYNEWIMSGLPANAFSLENGLSIRSSIVCPLIYDPNDLAANWIKRMEQRKNLRVFSCLEMKQNISALENAITEGCPILLLDPPSEPPLWLSCLLARRSFTKYSKIELLSIEGRDVAIGEGFRLYLTTKRPLRELSPFYYGSMTPINFEVNLETADATCARLLAAWTLKQKSSYADQVDMSFVHSVKQLLEVNAKRTSMLTVALTEMVENDTHCAAALQLNLNHSMITTKLKEVQIVVDAFGIAQKKCNDVSSSIAKLFIESQKLKDIDERFSLSFERFQQLVLQSTQDVEFRDETSVEILFQNVSVSLFQCIAEMVPSTTFKSFVFDCAVTVCEKLSRDSESDGKFQLSRLRFCNVSRSSKRFFENRSKARILSPTTLPEHPFLSMQQLQKLYEMQENIPMLAGICTSVYEQQKSWRDWLENGRFAIHKNCPIASSNWSIFDSVVVLCTLFPTNEYVFMEEFCNSVFERITFPHGLNCLSLISKPLNKNSENIIYLLIDDTPNVDWKEVICEQLQFWGFATRDDLKFAEFSTQSESQLERRLLQIIRAKQHVIIENTFQKFSWLKMILTKLFKEQDEELISKVFVVLPHIDLGIHQAPFYDVSRKLYCTAKLDFKDNLRLNSEFVLKFESNLMNLHLRKSFATFHSILGHKEIFPNTSVRICTRTLMNCLTSIEFLISSEVNRLIADDDEFRIISLIVAAHYGGVAQNEFEKRRIMHIFNRCLQVEKMPNHAIWTEQPDLDLFVKSLPTISILEFCGYREIKKIGIANSMSNEPQFLTSPVARELIAIQLLVPPAILEKEESFKEWFLKTEINIYNEQVTCINRILENCLNCGAQTDFEERQSHMSLIIQDKMPDIFPHQRHEGLSLRDYLTVLNKKHSYYLDWIKNGPPKCHDISMYDNIGSFLSHVYVGNRLTVNQSYAFTLKILHIETAGEIDQAAAHGVFVEGLLACSCKWDWKRRRFCCISVADERYTKLPVCVLCPKAEVQDAPAHKGWLPLSPLPVELAERSTESSLAWVCVDIQDDSFDSMVASNASLAYKNSA